MKPRIEYVNKKLKNGYIGMNSGAAHQLKIPFKHKHPIHTILIYHNVPHDVRYTTLRHEEAELYAIRCLKMNREKSHAFALKFEEKSVPFPKTQIKRNLIKMGFLRRK